MRLEDITSQFYAGSWVPVKTEPLVHNATKVEVTEHDFQDEATQTWRTVVSMCFTLPNGTQAYHKLSRDSKLQVGQKVDPKSIVVTTLSRPGDADIYRVDGKELA